MIDQRAYAEAARERILADIERYGRHIIGVCGCDGSLPFAYTIGNWHRSVSQLLVIGTAEAGFLNDLSAKMLKRKMGFANGEIINYPDWRLKIIDANAIARAEYTVQAASTTGRQLPGSASDAA